MLISRNVFIRNPVTLVKAASDSFKVVKADGREQKMIRVKICKGIPYIWDANDWLKLRKEHRIMGVFDGAEGNGWVSQIHLHLPLRLTTVEMQYLVAQGLAEAVHAPSLEDPLVSIDEVKMSTFLKCRSDKQAEDCKNKKKAEIESMVDMIIEGKRKKGRGGGILPDREAVLQERLSRIDDSVMELAELDFSDPWVQEEDYVLYNFPLPSTPLEKLKLRVFTDFHLRRKYYLTSGSKFGGDFLAYPGDPSKYHAEFIIVCQDNDRKYPQSHIATLCRLGSIVKKTILVAIVEEETDKLKYWLPPQSSCTEDSETEAE